MFEVHFGPFSGQHGARQDAHVILVKRTEKRVRILIQSIAVYTERRIENVRWFETAAEILNDPPSCRFRNLFLSSIKETWIQDDAQRRVDDFFANKNSFNQSHRADFGRMDMGRPGQGGSGIEGYW